MKPLQNRLARLVQLYNKRAEDVIDPGASKTYKKVANELKRELNKEEKSKELDLF